MSKEDLYSTIDKNIFLETLQAYSPSTEEELDHHRSTILFVSTHDDPFSRSTLSGHITASAWIKSPDEKSALLIHHSKLNLWFQPGGHIEAKDPTVFEAAKREALEETGLVSISAVSNNIFDIDVHTIPARQDVAEHLHYDIRYLFKAQSWDLSPDFSEVKAVEWVNIHDWINKNSAHGSVGRMMSKSISLSR